MRYASWFPLIVLSILGGIGLVRGADPGQAARSRSGFVEIFNGKNLDGWTSDANSSWVAEQGEIRLDVSADGHQHGGGYLWTKDSYGDFVLELEFKIPARANSGIFLRTADIKNPVQTGIEMQICNSHGLKQWENRNCCGAIYNCVAPTANTIKPPGQWNQCTITCRGPKITVVLNGKEIVQMDLDRWTQPRQNPDGSSNKFSTALKDFARKGRIGLQGHGLPITFRNLRVKRLDL